MQSHTNTEETKKQRNRGDLDKCIENCLECSRICLETVPECLRMGGQHSTADHIALLFNCADICQTSAKFMISGSPLHVSTCRACAEVCEACATDCRTIGEGMQECIKACDRCSETCRQMAAH
jgi:hypothetical protein